MITPAPPVVGPAEPSIGGASSVLEAPVVYVIVLNWNGWRDTVQCLGSLEAIRYPRCRFIVVDNGSVDNSLEHIRAWWFEREQQQSQPATQRNAALDANEKLVLLETGKNLGFAEGNNVGIRYALENGADFVLVLNNDTVVHEGMLDRLVAAFNQDAAIGIAAPATYYYGKPGLIWHAGGAVDLRRGRLRPIEFLDGASVPVDYVAGAGMMIRRKVLETTGLFDGNFFFTFEDTDLCLRAKAAGFRIVSVNSAKLWHKVTASTSQAAALYYYFRNRLLFFRKHSPASAVPLVTVSYLALTIRALLKRLLQGKLVECLSIVRGVVDGCKGQGGKSRSPRHLAAG